MGRAWPWLATFVGGLLFITLLSRISFSDFSGLIREADKPLLVLAVLVGLTTTILRALRYCFFFPSPDRFYILYGVFALLRLINYCLPFRTGELASLALLKKLRLSPTISETSPVWLIIRLTDLAAVAFLFSLILALEGTVLRTGPVVGWSILFLALVSLGGLAATPATGRRLAQKIATRTKRNWLRNHLARLIQGFDRLNHRSIGLA
ncbi:MAG: lysylphosphatidylglycerol synthase domain-containing protein, partial [Chlorobiales bacterium]|nr:lysylphosphatidylglycerol synthase domain-containing protein [Chlorobiales bacterium]